MDDVDDGQRCIHDTLVGNEAAYAALVKRYQQMIHAVTYRMTGSLAAADDLAQETFIRAFHRLGSFCGDAKFSTWLCRIAMHACLHWRQRESKRDEVHHRWAGDATLLNAHLSAEPRLITVERTEPNKVLGEHELGLSGATLAAKVESREERVAKLKQALGGKTLPAVSVKINGRISRT